MRRRVIALVIAAVSLLALSGIASAACSDPSDYDGFDYHQNQNWHIGWVTDSSEYSNDCFDGSHANITVRAPVVGDTEEDAASTMWTMLTQDDDNYVQAGWIKFYGTTVNTLVEASTDYPIWDQEFLEADFSVGQTVPFKVIYDNVAEMFFYFTWGEGVWFTPYVGPMGGQFCDAQQGGEIHNALDQMPGATSNHARIDNSEVRVEGGGWEDFEGTVRSDDDSDEWEVIFGPIIWVISPWLQWERNDEFHALKDFDGDGVEIWDSAC